MITYLAIYCSRSERRIVRTGELSMNHCGTIVCGIGEPGRSGSVENLGYGGLAGERDRQGSSQFPRLAPCGRDTEGPHGQRTDGRLGVDRRPELS